MYRIIAPLILVLASAAAAQTTQPTVTVELLGKITKDTADWRIAATLDYRHAAIIQRKDGKSFVMRDGKPEAAYDWIIPNSQMFNADGSTLAYIAQNKDDMFVVVNGQRGKPYYEVVPNLRVSTDGKHMTYLAKPPGGLWRVVTDGVETEKSYARILVLAVSPDGGRITYIAGQDDNWLLIDSGKEVCSGRNIQPGLNGLLSPDGKHLTHAYAKDANSKAMMVKVDDAEFGPVQVIRPVGFTNDSAHWVAVFRADGKENENTWTLYVDGKPVSKPGEKIIYYPAITKDAKTIAYLAQQGNDEYVVVNGRPQQKFPLRSISGASIELTDDGKHLSYLSLDKQERTLWLDGKALEKGEKVTSMYFNSDGTRWAYAAGQDDRFKLVVDGKALPPRRIGNPGSSLFSKDGKKLVYYVIDDAGNLSVAIDDVTVPTTARRVVGEQVAFESPQRVMFLAIDRDLNFNRYTIDYPKAP